MNIEQEAAELALAEQRATIKWINEQSQGQRSWLEHMDLLASENPDAIEQAVEDMTGEAPNAARPIHQHHQNINFFAQNSAVSTQALALMVSWQREFIRSNTANAIMYGVWFHGYDKTATLVRENATRSCELSVRMK